MLPHVNSLICAYTRWKHFRHREFLLNFTIYGLFGGKRDEASSIKLAMKIVYLRLILFAGLTHRCRRRGRDRRRHQQSACSSHTPINLLHKVWCWCTDIYTNDCARLRIERRAAMRHTNGKIEGSAQWRRYATYPRVQQQSKCTQNFAFVECRSNSFVKVESFVGWTIWYSVAHSAFILLLILFHYYFSIFYFSIVFILPSSLLLEFC